MESCCLRLSGDEPQARFQDIHSPYIQCLYSVWFCEDVLQPFLKKWPEKCGVGELLHRLPTRLVNLTFRESTNPNSVLIPRWMDPTPHEKLRTQPYQRCSWCNWDSILSCNMWGPSFELKKLGITRNVRMNIFVRSSKGQSRYPLISTVLLQKRIFSSYFEDGSWNTLPIGLGVCGPRWRIGWFEEKVFRPPPDLPSKTLPSMLSYFFFLYYRHPQAHGWKVCSSDIPTKIWWFHSHFGNFTYKQSHLFFHHLILRMWLTDRSGLELCIHDHPCMVFLSICTGTYSYHEKLNQNER